DNLRIESVRQLVTPAELHAEYPLSEAASATVHDTRAAIANILAGNDDRLLVVVGPCSIHDIEAALEYGALLKAAREQLAQDLLIVMRVYFEKPRTTVGWKGLINDPDLDDSFDTNKGIRLARSLLLQLADDGLPAGVEFLDLFTPQYLVDLVSWGAIGARTTESQGHRQMVSGLSCPVGFKNGTGGSIKIAVDAIGAARHTHNFHGYNKDNNAAIFSTTGNTDTHLVLRGGRSAPNYDADSVAAAVALLEQAGLPGRVMVDFSHANSHKQHKEQLVVGRDVAGQIEAGSQAICGVMIESHLKEGSQKLLPGRTPEYGKSITDACLHWADTEALLQRLAEAVRQRRELPAD
ncbi:MAG TPA: 3-deoxy-7-phosphoheptulonate synthase, partial [Salinisphaeraceae bacterium]|nr:3-deoxy-7-phosphoheptulonate synthase [Salinisphaeraceae bacterium]